MHTFQSLFKTISSHLLGIPWIGLATDAYLYLHAANGKGNPSTTFHFSSPIHTTRFSFCKSWNECPSNSGEMPCFILGLCCFMGLDSTHCFWLRLCVKSTIVKFTGFMACDGHLRVTSRRLWSCTSEYFTLHTLYLSKSCRRIDSESNPIIRKRTDHPSERRRRMSQLCPFCWSVRTLP